MFCQTKGGIKRLIGQWWERVRLLNYLNKNFAFKTDVYLVKGAKRGAIYDLNTGKVYSISDMSVRILELALKGKTPSDITKVMYTVGIYEILQFLNYLVGDLKVGNWYEGQTRPQNSYRNIPPPPLSFNLQLELTLGCNLRCIHCYAEGAPELAGQEKMSIGEWKRLIREAVKLNCKGIAFTGGEPLLVKELLFELIRYTWGEGISFGISTNATLITAEAIDFFTKYNVKCAVSLYAANERIHDSITRVQGSYRRTVDNLLKLKAKGIPIQIKTPVMSENQDYLKETEQFVKEKFNVTPAMSVAFSAGRACLDPLAHPDTFLHFASDKLLELAPARVVIPIRTAPGFSKAYKTQFIRRLHGHHCLFNGPLCVTSVGDVLPCPALRRIVLGNVKQSSLEVLLASNEVKHVWKASKDFVEVCRDCEYRYACADCQAIEGERLFVKPAWCGYNPYKGEWQNLGRGHRSVAVPLF